jgi:hypothetical protein
MHSSPGFKGKLTERWGRKATGLRDRAYDSGVARRNVKPFFGASSSLERSGQKAHRASSAFPPDFSFAPASG